ncbi:tRNA (N(6)-L-threonylcarbamoyladenosine(37)-C(2))-methylthiotransferase [Candidatus Woesearchaeota archaeon]|nr:tRNA (N(6)-L-threonylcarbamoyladenosine(37)-C(2))-methylthiotransferase [Candidatus Woesearchaeota archaeon]
MTKVFIQTHGCTANLVETQSMMGLLQEASFKIVDDPEYADVNIINICTVKGNNVALKSIKDIVTHYPDKKLIVTGCITQDIIKPIRNLHEDTSLINTHNIHRIVDAVEESLQGNFLEALTQERINKVILPKIKTNNVIGIIPIASGCADNCAYCSVKQIKGDIFSYPEEFIINEIKKALKSGCKEIWLTSQDNGSYGLDKGERKLHLLLQKILDEIPGDYKLRLGMTNPRHIIEITDNLIEIFQDDRMFKFIHLPAESGNNEILGKMNRKYTVHQYRELVDKLRRYVKDITIASDLIVGFPGETELQFQDSLHLIQETKPDVLNVARFSPRPNTLAKKMEGQISSDEKKERSQAMADLYLGIASKKNKEWIGWEGELIIDEKSKDQTFIGRNFAYKPITVKGNLKLGDVVQVKIKDASAHDLTGEIIKEISLKK